MMHIRLMNTIEQLIENIRTGKLITARKQANQFTTREIRSALIRDGFSSMLATQWAEDLKERTLATA